MSEMAPILSHCEMNPQSQVWQTGDDSHMVLQAHVLMENPTWHKFDMQGIPKAVLHHH